MKKNGKIFGWFGVIALLGNMVHANSIAAGRTFDPEKRFNVNLSVGQFTSIEGNVEETTRRLFEVTGEPERIKGQENYDLDELGLTESEITYGIQSDYMWKYVTLRLNATYLHAEASATAERDFFISVDEIEFQGQTYDRMKLEDGIPYSADLDTTLIGLQAQITPFTINPNGIVQVTPWIHVGLVGVIAEYSVDQGEPVRIQVYENPPEEYVVGGHGEGDEAFVIPEIGAGGEIRFRLGQRHEQPVAPVLQGNYAYLDYQGDTSELGIDQDKDLDVNYSAYEGRAFLEWPMTKGVNFLIGGEYRVIEIDGESKAKERSLEETVARREKFDKHIELELTQVSGFIGLRW